MKIRNQLFIIFLILGISATTIVSLLIFIQGKQIILNQFYSNLEAVSQAKHVRLEGMIKAKYENFDLIANTPLVRSELEKYSSNPGNFDSRRLDSVLTHFKKAIKTYDRLFIANPEGTVIGSSDGSFLGKDISQEESFKAIRQKDRYLDGFFYNPEKVLCITGGIAIRKLNGSLQGILLVDMTALDILSITNDYTGLGETGETVIAKKYSKVVYLTPTRFNKRRSFNIRIPENDSSYAMNKALHGKEGMFTGLIDYRKKEVIASTRYIADPQWGILTKMDKEEAYSNIRSLRNFLVLFNIGIILLAFIGSYYAGRKLARPLEELIQSTNKLKEGDLRSRVKKYPNNELGILAGSFNDMADKLENKINELDRFGYVLSHDLRAPLNNIIPLVHFIREDNQGKLNPESEKMLTMIELKAGQMNELILEILQSARSEKKTKEEVYVQSVVNMVVNDLRPPAHIEVYIPHNLPSVIYHKVSLIQIFQNLLGNAFKYSDKTRGKVEINFSEEADFYQFRISDNGPGIKQENLERIFEMFESANTSDTIESTGIGLGVVKKLVEENGGSITVTSEPGSGSTFYFTIPRN